MEITETEGQQQQETQPEKIFDADHDKWIDNPALKKKDDAGEDQPEAKAKTKKKEEPEEEEEETSEESEEGEEESKEEGEEESEEEESEEGEEEKSEEEDDKKKDDDGLSPDAYIAQVFGEKYGVKTEADLTNIVDKALDAMDELEALKKENATYKADSGKPKFPSKAHESAYEFVSKFDPNMQGEALQTFAKLVTMDLEKADPRMILEEQFVHQNPQWTRSEAQRMFSKEYARKYTLNREKFEGSDAEFAEEEADIAIMKKGDIAKATSYLKDLREKHKPAAAEAPKTNEKVTEAIKKNATTYGGFVDKAEEIVFEDGADKYVFKLDAEKKKRVIDAVNNWVKNPASYNEAGELVGAGTPEEMFETIVGGMFIRDISKALQSQVKNKVTTKRVEEIATKQPKKRSTPSSGEAKGNKDDLDEQAIRIIKKKAA
jgi:hypothetical protein